jgi:hypothetical protein
MELQGLDPSGPGRARKRGSRSRGPLSEEHKQKIRAANAGRKRKPLDEEHKRHELPHLGIQDEDVVLNHSQQQVRGFAMPWLAVAIQRQAASQMDVTCWCACVTGAGALPCP